MTVGFGALSFCKFNSQMGNDLASRKMLWIFEEKREKLLVEMEKHSSEFIRMQKKVIEYAIFTIKIYIK